MTNTHSGDTDTLLGIELLEFGGQYYGPAPELAGIEADTEYAVSDFVVRLTGQAVEAMDLAG